MTDPADPAGPAELAELADSFSSLDPAHRIAPPPAPGEREDVPLGFAESSGARARDDSESAGRIVTTVNPRIVPAGSRNPEPSAPSGHTRRTVLVAISALTVLGLLTGAFALYGGSDTRQSTGTGAAPGPEWNGGRENEAPGFGEPSAGGSPSDDGKEGEGDGDEGSGEGDRPGSGSPGEEGDGKDRPPQDDGAERPTAPAPPPGGSGGGGGPDGAVRLWSHNSDQCIHVPGGEGRDGTPLQVRTCSGSGAQRWSIEGDGTVRALGLCMDVANGSVENGAVIQLARCSGNPAQQFVLSEASDLVNPQADKCVAVRDGDVQSGTPLQLWECSGEDSQKWSPA
ncbi:ricin-type beta-trefoil lectin domain protein [Streptomyces ovatisporus]|uniref:Ricin-type beta-trefoil lectin domain protein n=1 Tax=Streptomyces ovatisporus TaxID=1128682 RepID=A0ABV9A999_9ACTN